MGKSLRARVLLVIALGCAGPVLGDGKFFPRVEVADEPGIAAQRAAVVFRDGVETLIVQSDVEGEDTAYGWVLPLPAEPTSIEAVAPYSLHGLGQVVRPRMAKPPNSILVFCLAMMVVMVVFCVDHLRRCAHASERVSPVRVFVAVLIMLLLASILLPSLARSRSLGSMGGDVEVMQTVKAGVYDVVVLKGETGEVVENWLASNGYVYPPSATAVLGEYLAEGWCFLAAKVSADADGKLTHHPLSVTFPAPEAIYPMRLTGVDGKPVQLDLYVVGERRASASGMRAWSCDVYEPENRLPWDSLFKAYACERPAVYEGKHYGMSVGIPEVSERMWPGCVLTRLHGRLEADDMREDLRLTWVDPTPMRATLYSRRHAIGWSGASAALTFAGLFAWFTWTAVRKRWSWSTMLKRRLAAALALALVVGAVRYGTFDIVPTRERDRHTMGSMLWVHRHVLDQLSKNPPLNSFPEAYRALLTEYEMSAEAEQLENPGDFRIEADGDGWRLTVLDQYYVPVTVVITADGVPRKAG